jgi:selenocysteine lyase/cysteine desulfurase
MTRSDLWPGGRGYLDTATYGLPPSATLEVARRTLAEWTVGSADWRSWNDAADEARREFAALADVRLESVAIGPASSTLLGIVAASLPTEAEVLVPEGDFTALLFPFLAQAERGVTVRTAPIEALGDAVGPSTTVVAWSAVQSADGRVVDNDAVLDAAAAVDALTIVDATQAMGWLPLTLDRLDGVVCSAYKWLCCPRGTAFLIASARLLAMSVPHGASWFAAEDVHASYYGTPMRLPRTARRLDLSAAWFAWVGAVASLRTLREVRIDTIHDHDVRLANELRAALDREPSDSAIVAVAGDNLEQELAAQGIKAATRASGCRLSFHVYNDEEDVAAAAQALRRHARLRA